MFFRVFDDLAWSLNLTSEVSVPGEIMSASVRIVTDEHGLASGNMRMFQHRVRRTMTDETDDSCVTEK